MKIPVGHGAPTLQQAFVIMNYLVQGNNRRGGSLCPPVKR